MDLLNADHSYATHFKECLEAVVPGLYRDFSIAATLPEEQAMRLLSEMFETGCQAQNHANIMLGRNLAVRLPREWLIARFEEAAAATIDMDDDWEFRRALEIALLLDDGLVKRWARRGLSSPNPEIVEIAETYSS